MTAALDVSYLADTVSEVARSCAIKTAERQNTEAEPYPLWDTQPVMELCIRFGRETT